MVDFFLMNLCVICYVLLLKYKCFCCNLWICFFVCIKKYKVWLECSGECDVIVYILLLKLCILVGVDYDYNFLYGIEWVVEWFERVFIGECGIV